MTGNEAIDEILRLARDPTLSDDALRDAEVGLLQRLAPEDRAAVSEGAQALLAEHRPH